MMREVIKYFFYSDLPYKNCVTFLKMNPQKIQVFELYLKYLKDAKRCHQLQGRKIPLENISFIRYRSSRPSRVVLYKRCSEHMQQMYRRTPMPKCVIEIRFRDGLSPVKFLHIFRAPLIKNTSGRLLL